MHPNATPGAGGLNLLDVGDDVLKAIKEVTGKIASSAARGQVVDMFNIPSPAYFHSKCT